MCHATWQPSIRGPRARTSPPTLPVPTFFRVAAIWQQQQHTVTHMDSQLQTAPRLYLNSRARQRSHGAKQHAQQPRPRHRVLGAGPPFSPPVPAFPSPQLAAAPALGSARGAAAALLLLLLSRASTSITTVVCEGLRCGCCVTTAALRQEGAGVSCASVVGRQLQAAREVRGEERERGEGLMEKGGPSSPLFFFASAAANRKSRKSHL